MRQAICWTLALGLLVSGRAFGFEARRFTIPPELKDVFREIERDYREFEKKDAAAARRLTSLEDELGAARSKIAKLETQLNLLRMKLDAMTGVVAKPPEAPPTPGPAEAEPKGTPTPPPAPLPAAHITGEERRAEGDSVVVRGTVENTTKGPLTFVIIEVVFQDAEGKPVATVSAYTEPRVIPAGAAAKFQVATKANPRIKSHKVTARTQ
jgi:uncharacterized coiled-coil protein SlyX